MKKLNEYLNSIPENYNPEEIYKEVLPFLVEANIFGVLAGNSSFVDFHKKIIELGKMQHGIGIAVSLMAQVNIAGRVLQLAANTENSPTQPLLKDLVQGKIIVSLGVSEPGWKGRLSNLKSNLTLADNVKYLLNGEKSFFTNGYHSSHFLVVVKLDQNYKVVLLDKNKAGLVITKFTLPFAQEATHCKIQFQNVEINKSEIIDFDYSKFAENLRLSEMLSLSAVYVGYALSSLEEIKENEDLVNFLREDEEKQKKLLRLKILLELLKSRILEISNLKDNDSNLELKNYFPYGLELVSEEYYTTLAEIFPTESLNSFQKEKQLFQYRDMLNESYIRRAYRAIAGLIKNRD